MKKEITIADKYGPAMLITEQVDADHYFQILVEHSMSFGKTKGEAEVIERANLGYYAGYYDNETRERVERLFACAHPVFGSIGWNGPPTFEEAFKAHDRLSPGSELERKALALEAVLLFHSGTHWDLAKINRWGAICAELLGDAKDVSREATTRKLCDLVRAALKES